MSKPICETCVYFVPMDDPKAPSTGRCKRYPPGFTGMVGLAHRPQYAAPIVSSSDWCGEHPLGCIDEQGAFSVLFEPGERREVEPDLAAMGIRR